MASALQCTCTNGTSISQECGQVKMRNASGAIFLQKSLVLVADCMPALLAACERQSLGLFSSSQELVHRLPHQR